MKKILLFCLFPISLFSSPWTFEQSMAVTDISGKKLFLHLDSSGRKNIAISRKYTAVIWEDNRNGKPGIYAAFKMNQSSKFSSPLTLSESESFEPVISHVSGDSFVAAWEERGRIRICHLENEIKKECIFLGSEGSSQPSFSEKGNPDSHIVWRQNEGEHSRIYHARIQIADKGNLVVVNEKPVSKIPLKGRQAYPAVAVSQNRIAVVWEDQRGGHTAIYSSSAEISGTFSGEKPVNEIIRKSKVYGEAQGTARPVIAFIPAMNRFVVSWLDKREHNSGYEVYTAFSDLTGMQWDKNEKVQDPLGMGIPQWHASTAVSIKGHIVSIWDDTRDGTSDLWFSFRIKDNPWSENTTDEIFSGPGKETSPSIVFDETGNLHAVYLRNKPDGTMQVMYTKGRLN